MEEVGWIGSDISNNQSILACKDSNQLEQAQDYISWHGQGCCRSCGENLHIVIFIGHHLMYYWSLFLISQIVMSIRRS